jgi:hypothetical protein
MAFEVPGLTKTFKAGADLSAVQYKFVKFDGSGDIVVAAAITDVCIGVLQNKPDASGENAIVMMDGITKMQAGGSISRETIIGTATDGQAQAVASTNKSYGVALDGVSSAAELFSMAFDCKVQAIVA